MTLKLLDLFSGIGGFSLGLERSGGFKTVAFCEIEEYPQAVLRKHWPKVPIYDDIRTLTAERLATDGIAIDAICGGFPCQDISTAGKGAGIDGERSGLWKEYARLIGELRPRYAIVENVAALLGRGLGRVLGDLAAVGYDAEWHCISASAVGAPHERDRVWIVAYPSSEGLEGLRSAFGTREEITDSGRLLARANAEAIQRIHGIQYKGLCAIIDRVDYWPAWGGQQWPKTEPFICRVDDGIPDRVGRTSACGNAVVPQIPEIIGKAIMEHQAAVAKAELAA